jgi:hypothetical protein
MEMSSPLAAMHPPPLPAPWGLRRDLPSTKPLFGGHAFGPKSFNFRDLSMKKSNTDYFNLQPLRGSSPTASLAADMSSNLHVDQRYPPLLPQSGSSIELTYIQSYLRDSSPRSLHVQFLPARGQPRWEACNWTALANRANNR